MYVKKDTSMKEASGSVSNNQMTGNCCLEMMLKNCLDLIEVIIPTFNGGTEENNERCGYRFLLHPCFLVAYCSNLNVEAIYSSENFGIIPR
jgi:hypothetical protein